MQLPVEHSRYAPLVFRRLTCCSSAQMRILATTANVASAAAATLAGSTDAFLICTQGRVRWAEVSLDPRPVVFRQACGVAWWSTNALLREGKACFAKVAVSASYPNNPCAAAATRWRPGTGFSS